MSSSPSELVTLHWENIHVKTKAGRDLLKGISGIVRPGELCALMGASGAGKTTLLNTLLCRNTTGLVIEGGIYVNGQNVGRGITNVSSYVQQEDLFVGNLTVHEHLMIQARMRLSSKMSGKERSERVEEVMTCMLLQNSRDSKIGVPGIKKGISGGEMKRLAFATEILTNPPILFCDEPTTGLDSHMAMLVVKQLERLADNGMNIVCTIHQPSSEVFELFDKVVFLSQGRIAFIGTPPEAVGFFATCGHVIPDHTNPADYYIQQLAIEPGNVDGSKKRANKICDEFINYPLNDRIRKEIEDAQRPRRLQPFSGSNLFTLTLALFQRYMLDNMRNPSVLRAKVAQKLFMGVFLGLLYLPTKNDQDGVNSIKGALFYYISELTYSTIFGIQTYLPGDFPLLVREYHDGIYPAVCYYVARVLSYLPIFTIDGMIMVSVSYFMVGLYPSVSAFLHTLCITILIQWCTASLGVMVCSITPSYSIAVSLTGPLLTVFSITGGLFTNVAAMPDWSRWVQYLSWFRYGYESLIINEWSQDKYTNISCHTKATQAEACIKTGAEVIEQLSFTPSNLYFNMGTMFCYVLIVYIIGYIGLVYRVQRAR